MSNGQRVSGVRQVLRAARVFVHNFRPPERVGDHRAAVGGLWDVIGPLQFDFLRAQGVRPDHRLLDIGCGSLRAGRLLIPYLDRGCYLGLDADEPLVRAGVAAELEAALVAEKQPVFAFNDRFDFSFDRVPDVAIAHSLFTHLTPEQMTVCLSSLRAFAPQCVLYLTFNESAFRWPNWFAPHAQRTYFYTRGQLATIAGRCGWSMSYIGEWGHPRQQRMVCLQAAR